MTEQPAQVSKRSSVRSLVMGAAVGLWLAVAGAPAQTPDPEWSTAQGQACIERWISVAMGRLNAHAGGASFDANKPYRINQWGVLEGRNFHSVGAPDDFASYGYNKYRRMWEVYRWNAATGWTDDRWDAAGVPPLQPWVRNECLAGATASLPAKPPQPLTPPQGNACGYSLGSGIHAKWLATGGERGFLGCPVSNETEAGQSPEGTNGRFAAFAGSDGGYVIWHGSGPRAGVAFEVHGCVFRLYRQAGGTVSWLGFPVSDEYDVPGGRRSDFEGGYVLWELTTRQCKAYPYGAPGNGSAARCEEYATRAVAQNRENEERKCGFTGPRWHAGREAHRAWCLGVDPAAAEAETKGRQDELARCGGAAPPPASGTYLGCYLDKESPNRDLSGYTFTDSQKMTVELCVASCREKGFAYAGLQYVEYCFCGNSYGKYGPANSGSNKCEVICSGNRDQVCGGYLCNSVYSTGASRGGEPTLEPDTDRLGSDYRDFDLPRAEPAACREACLRDERCQAWTYVKPDTLQGPRPRCWLKQAIPPPTTSACCVSGVKGAAGRE